MNRKSEVLQQIVSFLRRDKVRHHLSRSRGIARFGFRGDHTCLSVRVAVDDAPLTILILVELPVVVPDDKRAEAAELVCRANYGLRLGRFELDMSEGDVNFVVAVPLVNAELTEKQFHYAVSAALIQSDRYSRALSRFLFNEELSPAEAVAEVEMASSNGRDRE